MCYEGRQDLRKSPWRSVRREELGETMPYC